MESSNLVQTHSRGDSQTGRRELRILRRDRELRRRGCDAGAMFNAVPIILLVIFFQKYFIRSAASSAVKG